MRRVLIGLAIFLGAFVIIDFLARDFAEGAVADELKPSLGLTARPDVSIGGWPFLLDALGGRLESISIEAEGVEGQGLELSRLDVQLNDVKVSLSAALSGDASAVRVRRGRGSVVITAGELSRILQERGAPFDVTLEPGSATATSPELPQSIEVHIFVRGATLVIEPVARLEPIEIPLPRFIRGLNYESVEIEEGRAVLEFSLKNASLRR